MTKPDFPGEHDYSLLGENHVRAYRESGGEVGYIWNGAPTLLLTTTGRRSGLPRTIPIIYGRVGADHLLVASRGGAPKHPHWYLNLQADPEAEIQVRREILQVTARTAAEDEKPRLWKIMTGLWPNYDVYQARTDRIIPVVVLSPR
ncbi:nitroreductase family deazaflavin-dependent oxidoreductase [Actinomadura rugatobispora]|uniref:Nitroreductase family deazaflavin-dependent oxidoreductase n=1 Tax=Actinomadura rugatobispora TaxID=1994 RepID=A0ABW0ZNV9_9ACTN|nr:nitroreductase family deazaflavin-dependent oxidoreductase [Actinomadura rugatobispora]